MELPAKLLFEPLQGSEQNHRRDACATNSSHHQRAAYVTKTGRAPTLPFGFLLLVGIFWLGRGEALGAPAVTLIGIDGADWEVLQPLLDQGQLPGLARMKKEGAWGDLESFEPLLSPLIWTSIATGRLPEDHGVLDFMMGTPPVPARSLDRKVPALWNLVSAAGKSAAVTGWIATWPPEKIKGSILSDRASYHSFLGNEARKEAVPPESLSHPENLWPRLKPWAEEAASKPAPFVKEMQSREKNFQEGEQDVAEGFARRVRWLESFQCTDALYFAVFQRLRQESSPALNLVYLSGLDGTSHLFMPLTAPWREDVPENLYQQGKDAVALYARWVDGLIMEVLDSRKPGETVIVVSDHGFRSGAARPESETAPSGALAPLWHRRQGVVALLGPDVKAGHSLEKASVLDLAPTVLDLLQLPALDSMPGKILITAFKDGSAPANPPKRDKDYGGWRTVTMVQDNSPADEKAAKELREKLETLGYTAPLSATTLNNEGLRLLEVGRSGEAVQRFLEALKSDAGFNEARVNLGAALRLQGRYDEAYSVLSGALTKARTGQEAGIHSELGLTCLALEKREEVREHFQAAKVLNPQQPGILTVLAVLAEGLGETGEALNLVEEALKRGPDDLAETENNAVRLLLRLGRRDEAFQRLQAILKRDPKSSLTYSSLGLYYGGDGHLEEAREAFAKAVSLDSRNGAAWENLGITLGKLGRKKEALKALEKALQLDPGSERLKALTAGLRREATLEEAGSKEPPGTRAYLIFYFLSAKAANRFSGELKAGKELQTLAKAYLSNGDLLQVKPVHTIALGDFQDQVRAVMQTLDPKQLSDPVSLGRSAIIIQRIQ